MELNKISSLENKYIFNSIVLKICLFFKELIT